MGAPLPLVPKAVDEDQIFDGGLIDEADLIDDENQLVDEDIIDEEGVKAKDNGCGPKKMWSGGKKPHCRRKPNGRSRSRRVFRLLCKQLKKARTPRAELPSVCK